MSRSVSESSRFEQEVERIHRLLEDEGAQVTWDEHLPDPDNPGQLRQIDVTIRRDGKLTLVECRIHQSPQDVTWIEELIGRRLSLKADAVIAVSNCGFTKGARLKAERFGVILREFRTLTEDEVRNWGRATEISLSYYIFPTLSLRVLFRAEDRQVVLLEDGFRLSALSDSVETHSILDLVQQLIDHLDRREKFWESAGDFELGIECSGFLVNGVAPLDVELRGKIIHVTQTVRLASVVTYTEPGEDQLDEDPVRLEKRSLAGSEVIQKGDEVSVLLDLSSVHLPPHFILGPISMDFGRTVQARLLEPIGFEGIRSPDLKYDYIRHFSID
jgi:Restriction endonuclease